VRNLAAILLCIFVLSALPTGDVAPAAQLIAKHSSKSAKKPACGQTGIAYQATASARIANGAFEIAAGDGFAVDKDREDGKLLKLVGRGPAVRIRFSSLDTGARGFRDAIYSGIYIRRLPGRSPPSAIA
jgi:hypothetical protein